MSYLFPIYYVYVGNAVLAILLFIGLQQLCWSPVNVYESPGIRSKVLVLLLCTATYILNWLLIYHYSHHLQHEPVTILRLWTAGVLCLGALTTFKFVVTSFDALYKSKKNQNESPKWFVLIWKISMSSYVLAVLFGTFAAYWFRNGVFFHLYYIVIDITLIIGCAGVIIAMLEIRKRIKQIIINTRALSAECIQDVAPSSTINYYQKQTKKLVTKKCKFDLILIVIVSAFFTVLYNLYVSIDDLELTHPIDIYESPYPTLMDYIVHCLFNLALNGVLVLWIYKPCRCCRHHRRKNKASKVTKSKSTMLATPKLPGRAAMANGDDVVVEDEEEEDVLDGVDVNEQHVHDDGASSTTVEDHMIVLYLCCPCFDCRDDRVGFQEFQQKLIQDAVKDRDIERMRNKVKQRRMNMNVNDTNGAADVQHLRMVDETVTAMPKRSSTVDIEMDDNEHDRQQAEKVKLCIYNFENLLLYSPNALYEIDLNGEYAEVCQAFGGGDRAEMLRKHMCAVTATKETKICIFSYQIPGDEIECALQRVSMDGLVHEVVGSDHQLFRKNPVCSLNEKILKITQKYEKQENISPHCVLYIDSQSNAKDIKRFNICDTFECNVLYPLTADDIVRIEQRL